MEAEPREIDCPAGGQLIDVLPLAGWTVGVTAARRADELGSLLERRGARVTHAPAIRLVPLPDDTELLAATRACVDDPIDLAVATTGIGFRGWIEAADGWGLGDALRERLAGLVDAWSPASESCSEVLDHLLTEDLENVRIAVQLHGEPLPDFVEALRAAGADVVEVPVYRWVPPEDMTALLRMVELIVTGAVDAVAFTSAPAVVSLLRTADAIGEQERMLEAFRNRGIPLCVGAVTASPLERREVPTVQPGRARIGAMVRELGEVLPARAPSLRVAGHQLQLRGSAVVIDDRLVPLPPAPMALLRTLMRHPGRVVSRAELLRAAPGDATDEHAVEMAVARVRSALMDARCVQTVVKRGYRLAYDPPMDDGIPADGQLLVRTQRSFVSPGGTRSQRE
ncbi:uroporphyrinogen-III synthase [Nakamurella sp. PAMC28650]|uniref:uroporphyrinogen-III synthase n=1 Tax=Nakamurella sp. PAMC28650 TaxID=2762325 RepID=UPI00164DAAB0|nr:uroporphyrinogen-III synthase [Nakamurella sp. PAMC28650]QNK81684.1 uroporphyrinogen-III synthase [Nakamurella sp. PAMC28650]